MRLRGEPGLLAAVQTALEKISAEVILSTLIDAERLISSFRTATGSEEGAKASDY